jgi:hypothetical protein
VSYSPVFLLKLPNFIITEANKSYDNLFRLPEDVLQRFQQITGWTNEPSLISEELYIVEPGLNYNSSFNGTLIFTLNNGFTIEIPNEELAWPLRRIDTTGQRVLQSNVTVVNIFNQEAPEYTAVLGKVFLSQACLIIFLHGTLC